MDTTTGHAVRVRGTGSQPGMPYSWRWLDRATARRADPDWLAGARTAPGVRVVPVWRDRCIAGGVEGRAIVLDGDRARQLLDRSENPDGSANPSDTANLSRSADPGEAVFLGADDAGAVFAVDMSTLDEAAAVALAGGAATVDVRAVFGTLTPPDAALLAYARGILHWSRNQRYCGRCGGATAPRDGGQVRACLGAGCGRLLFPRIEPAVIVLVESPEGGRCLLARHRRSVLGAFSTLAGFVEIGESLEDAVHREVAEEAGVTLREVSYLGSQPWPFPAGLMVAFHARASADAVEVDGDELVEARWFTRAELADRAAAGDLGRVDSIDRVLFHSWLTRTG